MTERVKEGMIVQAKRIGILRVTDDIAVVRSPQIYVGKSGCSCRNDI